MLKANVEITPDRVYAICKLIAKRKYRETELKEIMILEKNDVRFSSVYNYCISIGLIIKKNGILECIFSNKVIYNKDNFSFELSKIVLNKDEKFLKLVSEITNEFDKKYYLANNYQGILNKLPNEIIADYSVNYIRVIRFWIKFFQIGFYDNNNIIIYPVGRIKNFLKYDGEIGKYKNKIIQIDKFLNMLFISCPELKLAIDKEKFEINFILSTVLLSLEESGEISMEYTGDSLVYYKLTGNILKKKSRISEIIIRR